MMENKKHESLEAVTLAVEGYFSLQEALARQQHEVARRIELAREDGATQQQIANATVVTQGSETRKLSRQRVAQILQGK